MSAKRYLLTVTESSAAQLEQWLGGPLAISPWYMDGPGRPVKIAALDAVTDEEIAPVIARLASGGPLYHAGGSA